MKKEGYLAIASILIFALLMQNISATSISQWLNNQTIHYTTKIAPIISNLTLYLNNSYLFQQYNNYYLNNTIYRNSNSTVDFYVAKNASFPFIKNMLKDNVSYCTENSFPLTANQNSTQEFFFNLCSFEKQPFNLTFPSNYSAAKAKAQMLAQSFISPDNFTKQLYQLYYEYSINCKQQHTSISNSSLFINSYCSGSQDNYSLPNPFAFEEFYSGLYDYNYMTMYANNPQIPYTELKYDINNASIYPTINNAQLIQTYSNIAGLYPGILPSGEESYNLSNDSVLILPIKILNNSNLASLEHNYFNITSGIFNNVSLFITAQQKFNDYAIYNISTNQAPFQGNVSSGYETYSDSCGYSPGLSSVENSEYQSLLNNIYSSLYNNNLYPTNFQYQYANTYQQSKYYTDGPSIIEANYSNLEIGNTTIYYGVETTNNQITYENHLTANLFSPSTQLFKVILPNNAFINQKMKVFIKSYSPFSYTMNYYQFKENTGEPAYSFNHYTYQTTRTKIVGNKTVTYTVTCYVSQVSTSLSYSAEKTFLSSNNYNENYTNTQTINVSTNLPITNIFKKNSENLYTGLNYTYDYKLVNTSPSNITEYTRLRLPLMSFFDLYSPNGTLIYAFDSYQFDNNLITTNFSSFYTTISKNLYSYDPAFAYPDTYATIPVLYPTIESTYSNSQYLEGIKQINNNGVLGNAATITQTIAFEIYKIFFGDLFSGNLKTNFIYGVMVNNEKEYLYYEQGCSSTNVGPFCIINKNYYTYGQNITTTTSTDYDLLNPSIYTQGSFYAGIESPSWLCAKASFLTESFGQLFSCLNPIKNNMTKIGINTDQLNFNTNWGNANQTDKQLFYNYLQNATINTSKTGTYYVGYSYLHPPSYQSQSNSSTIAINNYITNANQYLYLTKAYPYLVLDGCDYNFCFNVVLYPTNKTLTGFYNYQMANRTSFLFEMQPDLILNNKTINPQNQITFSVKNVSKTFTLGKYFYVNYVQGNTIEIQEINNTIPIIEIIDNESFYNQLYNIPSVNITFASSIYSIPNMTIVFPYRQMTLKFLNEQLNTIFYICLIIIITGILYFLGVFKEIETNIRARIEKMKTKYF